MWTESVSFYRKYILGYNFYVVIVILNMFFCSYLVTWKIGAFQQGLQQMLFVAFTIRYNMAF